MTPASVVVVTWKCADELRGLVRSLNEHLPAEAGELVVVDNASDDDPQSALADWHGDGNFERLPENRGYGAAANRGVELARHEVTVLINPDARLLDDGLPRLADEALSRRALVGPRVVREDGRLEPSASGPPVGVWPWLMAFVPGAALPPAARRMTAPWRLETPARVSWLSASCLAAPTAVLRELGPFDTQLEMYAEDMDLSLRAEAAGIERWFLPGACRVEHRGQASSSQRYDDAGAAEGARNRRGVIRRAYGSRRERRAWAAHKLGLRLRVGAGRLLRRPANDALAPLRATHAARSAPELEPFRRT
jgi:GT2 family glycosyltransferase